MCERWLGKVIVSTTMLKLLTDNEVHEESQTKMCVRGWWDVISFATIYSDAIHYDRNLRIMKCIWIGRCVVGWSYVVRVNCMLANNDKIVRVWQTSNNNGMSYLDVGRTKTFSIFMSTMCAPDRSGWQEVILFLFILSIQFLVDGLCLERKNSLRPRQYSQTKEQKPTTPAYWILLKSVWSVSMEIHAGYLGVVFGYVTAADIRSHLGSGEYRAESPRTPCIAHQKRVLSQKIGC